MINTTNITPTTSAAITPSMAIPHNKPNPIMPARAPNAANVPTIVMPAIAAAPAKAARIAKINNPINRLILPSNKRQIVV